MGRRVAPPKATGGGGGGFENNVAAYFLSFLLAGRPPLNPDFGVVSRIDFQTRVDGWFLDDMLLTLTSGSRTRQCAFSAKSGQQFTGKRVPREFVEDAWRQYLHDDTEQFVRARDRLGLITRPLPGDLFARLNTLLAKARAQDPRDLPTRLQERGYASQAERSLFASLACPENLRAKYGPTSADTAELAQHLEFLTADFEIEPSTFQQNAVGNCQSSLTSGSPEEAASLWRELVSIASTHRPVSGYVDRVKLVDRLRSKFRLRDYPDHEEDWSRLLAQAKQGVDAVADRIGGRVSLPRKAECEQIDAALAAGRAVALLGPSGCGKTVTAKSWSATHPEFTKVLWWSATSLDVASFAAFESAMSLSHRLPDLLAAAGDSRACVVIDGLDRVFSDTAFANVSALIRGLRLDDAASPWCVLVTCQLEEWGRVQRELARANLVLPGLRVIQVADLPPDDLDPVWREFPALRPLSLRPHLRDLLAKPKILDLLATRVLLGAPIDAQQWVGESDVVAWFWEEVVRTHPKAELRARFLQLLGERQADSLESETPRSSFRVEDLSPVDGLVHDRLCDVHDERLSFCHDLYGDWARQRILVGHADRVGEYIEQRITSPLWHRALRLYGLHLLEQHEDVAQWRSVLNSLGSGTERRAKKRESVPAKWRPVFDSLHPRTHDFNTAQDLVLESVIFAADPLPLLERMWPELQAEGGVLLHRLLARFLHVATLPNPLMLRIASAIGEDFTAEAATMQRVPYWPYWLRMIQFLHNHSADVTQLALQQVAEIADTWLRRGGAGWLRRREAAELGIAAAEHTLRLNREHGTMSGQSKIDCAAYSAGLAGAAELPDRVAAFALDASQRVTGSEGASARDGRSSTVVRRVRVSGPLGSYEFEMPPPWPDGPSERVNEAFRNTCLDTDALHPLVLSDPVVARQVLLALMIQEPREPDESFSSALEEDLEVETMHTWFPPFYLRGPFLFFLQNQATEGLDLILRLVNFATERWADRRCAGNRQPPSVTVPFPEGDREHVGDGTVCFWYRDVGSAPHVVVSALMALEKWLYMQLDEKRPIGDTVRLLLRSSNSLAIVGLLIAVGKKAPALFLDELLPLLAVPEFYRWEIQHQIANEGHQMIGWDMLPQNRTSSEPARHGHSLPHRRISLACVIREACCEGGRVGFGLC